MKQEKRKLTAEDVARLPELSSGAGVLCEVQRYIGGYRKAIPVTGIACQSPSPGKVRVTYIPEKGNNPFGDYDPTFVTIHEELPAAVAEPDSAGSDGLELAPA
ncbi:MAG: hypothetical protein KBD16_00240 [Candidatus Pacebacteria bacterium]|nr:hypothetical protein [Candidatus Paceibacterota bacterium]